LPIAGYHVASLLAELATSLFRGIG
jgi:hypothetical protein